ncbi:outer membrane beta-barrel protein [Flavobacterium reichenbachii]|uniref:Outer membrane protein beta-barrel domain-containing protein n=1 Tax=Flavobacterium reichenbachii TaxID=362418 RepID=A0A085ZSF3_9FLAO|nr:outer membrane beta-barrel protein [Flavobacterium reichenbachii]KFF07367.1 hypothetical protein IW19_18455 [Flavobacterium reichenbachii]OXB13152.1 hypothetical protein B0A68_15385 [Flavobacterium reichenbachii]
MSSKKILIFTTVFLSLIKIHAQDIVKPGIRAGLGLSTISEMHASYKADFYAGAFAQINLTKYYSLQPEINYSRQGSNNVGRNYFDEAAQTDRVEYRDLKMEYLSLGIMNKFTFGPGLQLQVGPSLDILLNDNLVVRKTANDLAVVAGIAYAFPSGITIEARFKKGLFDVLDSDYYYNDRNDYYLFGDYNTNNNFQIGISYTFKVK